MFEPVGVLAYYRQDGTIEPIRFRYNNKEYRCGQLLSVTENKFAGNPMVIFRFQKGQKDYELRFEKNTGKWYIMKT